MLSGVSHFHFRLLFRERFETVVPLIKPRATAIAGEIEDYSIAHSDSQNRMTMHGKERGQGMGTLDETPPVPVSHSGDGNQPPSVRTKAYTVALRHG